MKKRVLCWGDSVMAGTGFGTVSRHVLKALHSSGMFEIDQLAINHNNRFLDMNKIPYQIISSALGNPNDVFGNKMFLEAFASGRYDYVWVMNDTFVVEKAARQLPSIIQQMKDGKRKIPKLVYYYPVDCKLLESATTMIRVADVAVAYCKYGEEKTLSVIPDVAKKLRVINHGVDPSEFSTLDPSEKASVRQRFLDISPDSNKFVWVQINRNSPRKDLPKTLLAFKRFQERVEPNSMMYLHTAVKDMSYDLMEAVRDLGLDPTKDVVFPKNYSSGNPFPTHILNMLYNCGDAFLSTSLGEGWGLSHLEAAATGIPLVCPENTCFPEQLDHGSRGYLYECKEKTWIDNSGYRPVGLLEDIVDVMERCFNDVRSGEAKAKVENCQKYLDSIEWKKIGDQWVSLFKEIEAGVFDKPAGNKKTVGEML